MTRKAFVKCGPIATKLDMEVAGYDACIIDQYNGNMSKDKVIEIVKNTHNH